MRKYQMTALFAVYVLVFITIATLANNRVIIAILFVMLLSFIAVEEQIIRRLRDREKELTDQLEALAHELQALEESPTGWKPRPAGRSLSRSEGRREGRWCGAVTLAT